MVRLRMRTLLLTGVLLTYAAVAVQRASPQTNSPESVPSAAPNKEELSRDLLARTLHVFGRYNTSLTSSQPKEVTSGKDDIPFLSTGLSRNPGFALTAHALVAFKGGLHNAQKVDREFEIYLHPDTKRVIKVQSDVVGPLSELPSLPTGEIAAAQMLRSGEETYHSFPDDDPTVAFVDALDSVFQGGGAVTQARQIVGHYVMWSRMGKWRDPRPVWAITLIGIPPVHAHTESIGPILSWFRYIVDARTGKLLCGANTPRPVQYDAFAPAPAAVRTNRN